MKLFDLDKLINTLTGYIETRIELLKIDVREGLSFVITKLVFVGILSLFGFFIVLFLFLGLAAILNKELESHFWGYLIVAAFFGLVLFIALLLKGKIADRIREEISEAEDELEELEEEQNS